MPSDFIPSSEELQRLAEEISLLRRDFQSGMATLSRMEKRLKAAFPTYPAKKPVKAASTSKVGFAPARSREDLLAEFESITDATRQNGDLGFESSLSNLSDQDVLSLAYELGVGSLKTTSLKKAREGIRKRVQESLLLVFENRSGEVHVTTEPPFPENDKDTVPKNG